MDIPTVVSSCDTEEMVRLRDNDKNKVQRVSNILFVWINAFTYE